MLSKRIVPCLDVRNRKVTKGVKFQNNIDLGDPIEMAVAYSDGGADELVFYDITASAERRPIDIAMVEEIGRVIHIPFAVGGGIENLDDMYRVLLAGAFAAALGATLINPYGLSMWYFLGETVRLERPMIADWQPLYALPPLLWMFWLAGAVMLALLEAKEA